MRNDETTEYRYGKLGGKESQRLGLVGPSTLNTGKNEKGNDVFTMFTENNIGNKLHETRHGGDLARGTLKYNTTGGYGVSHEISAYKAQYSWSGSLSYIPYTDFNNQTNLMRLLGGVENLKITITHINQINLGVVNSMVDNPGLGQILIYPPVIDRNGTRMSLSIWNNN